MNANGRVKFYSAMVSRKQQAGSKSAKLQRRFKAVHAHVTCILIFCYVHLIAEEEGWPVTLAHVSEGRIKLLKPISMSTLNILNSKEFQWLETSSARVLTCLSQLL